MMVRFQVTQVLNYEIQFTGKPDMDADAREGAARIYWDRLSEDGRKYVLKEIESITFVDTTEPDQDEIYPSQAQLDAAMDAFYPGEDWRASLGCALETSLRDMRAALRAARSLTGEA